MADIANALRELVDALNGLAIGGVALAFLALAGIGSIAMAAVQTLKELTPLRRVFQHNRVQSWLACRQGTASLLCRDAAAAAIEYAKRLDGGEERLSGNGSARGAVPTGSEASVGTPHQDASTPALVQLWAELAVGGNLFAFFSPPAEQMASYMKQAIPVMLDEAKRYKHLIAVLAVGVATDDLAMMLVGPTPETRSDYFDSRARVTRRIERSIEGLEVDISTRWKFWMQVISLCATAVVVEASVIALPARSQLTYVIAIPMGLLGGYFAPIMRDLVAALQKLRQG